MKHLPQKCFIASAGVHTLLMVILLIGPAFLAPKSRPDNRPPLDVISGKLVDDALSHGGRPDGTPPVYAPPIPPAPMVQRTAPPPEPPTARPQERAPEPVKPDLPDPQAVERKTDRKPRLPDVPTTPVVRKRDTGKPVKPATTPSAEEIEAQRVADRNARLAAAAGASARALRPDLKSGISMEPLGNGTGGELFTSYDDAVRSTYLNDWKPSADAATDAAITKATILIASDGTVLSARIIKSSGDASVDRSVQETLDRVKYIAPFPPGAKEKQRTYTIKFDLKAKRLS